MAAIHNFLSGLMGSKCDENDSLDPNARFGPGATAELNSGNTGTSKLSAQHSKHAQNLWSMLDDMAENDPERYKAFLEKQAREAVHSLLSQAREAVHSLLSHFLPIWEENFLTGHALGLSNK